MPTFSALLIGHESLTLHCGQMLLDAGHSISGVVTSHPDVATWANAAGLVVAGLVVAAPGADLNDLQFDWVLSIANLDIIPQALLDRAGKGAVNFHDGPLPRYAGLNAPVWAILNREPQHGITWHFIENGIDQGDIIAQDLFAIASGETALTLNTKCYAAAMDSFPAVISALATTPPRRVQDLTQRSYFSRDQRPDGRIDLTQPAGAILALIRALDHGDYWNPLTCPKIMIGQGIVLVGAAHLAEGPFAPPGTVLAVTDDQITLATGSEPISLSRLRGLSGVPFDTSAVKPGAVLAAITAAQPTADMVKAERHWRKRLDSLIPASLNLSGQGGGTRPVSVPPGQTEATIFTAFAGVIQQMTDSPAIDLAWATGTDNPLVSPWVPVRFGAIDLSAEIATARAKGSFAADLLARLPGHRAQTQPQVGLTDGDRLCPGTALTLAVRGPSATLIADPAQLSIAALDLILARLEHALAHPDQPQSLPPDEIAKVTTGFNATAVPYDQILCIHQHFEAQVARTPNAMALHFEGQSFSYAALNAAANKVAHVLRTMGVGPGTLVGLYVRRSAELLIGALAIQKAGGAYVPLDPAYPADRIALYIADSGCPVILTLSDMQGNLPVHAAQVLRFDDPRIPAASDTDPDSGVTSSDLAYLIYTSGSTGRPKGVMIEHRNVLNFFTGMDARISHNPPGVWLAVTSLSFDISVLELFWTLARGFAVVMSGDDSRSLVSSGQSSAKGMEFSLFYWGNDDGVGRDKYKLLLEGAKFADQNGFVAVWTPERHFHAFGGPYPNPSVTGAAVAAVTQNLAVRAGSCVAPLHHTARIAEEWAVIDNLTGGKVGLAIASGWQPDDFVLRPEHTPPANKPAMFQAIKDLRRLWAGDAVEFPTATGAMFPVVTQPRPVSTSLPIWVTTAGNPETWREAGSIGANVLTHLLGQSVAEVAGKIGIYHQALRAAGHDPADHKVTLMLHTFLAETRDQARQIAREPMKDYLRSAAALIKTYAWAFPAFKKPVGAATAMDIDLGALTPDELEGILDFAFLRYFDESGLFGTVQDAVLRIDQLKAIGVDEVACLIDYGIPVATVLDGLKPLAQVLRQTNQGVADDDYSIAAQIDRHKVTHLQCTPSMARMLVTNDESRNALARVQHLMIGGEALPGALVGDLRAATDARIENMYGPTETTIWSATQPATATDGTIGIGRPIANTQVYVLDAAQAPLPIGKAGELYIGGDGVARGYWQRDDQTADRFLPNPFAPGRLYRTGDLGRWRADGGLDFLGRTDHQVKLRGYRIELGEIEAALDAVPGIRQAVVVAREDIPGLVQLVAYLTVELAVTEAALVSTLGARLPAHMVPSRFITLDRLPLTPNKKVDRKALPAPTDRTSDTPVVTGNTTEAQIAAIWSRLLGVTTINSRDSFFELGGHSLLAVQAHREIRDSLGAAGLSITDIFRYPTLAALAAKLDEGKEPVAASESTNDRAAARADAMSRRRDMRARRTGSP